MKRKMPGIKFAFLTVFFYLINLTLCSAEPTNKKGIDYDYVEYVHFLDRLNKSNPQSVLVAKNELFSKFADRTDESKNDAFRAFWKCYSQVIRDSDRIFSAGAEYQNVLSEIAEATKEYHNAFTAFEKIDNGATRNLRKRYPQILDELHAYKKAGMNFHSSEGTWYLTPDSDFLLAASDFTIGDYKQYVRFYAEESRKQLVDDAALMISWEDLRKRIIRWEMFADQHPQLAETEKEVKAEISWMMNVYFTGIDNSRVVGNGERLESLVRSSYESFLKENTSSHYYPVVNDVYALWNKNDFKVSRELVDYLKNKGYANFISLLEQNIPAEKGKEVEADLSRQAQGAEPRSTRAPENVLSTSVAIVIFIGVLLVFAILILLWRRS